MKDSLEKVRDVGVALALAAAVLAVASCAKSNKSENVAQDSILVKGADPGQQKSDSTATTTTLVRNRGSAAELPVLTNGAAVKRPRSVEPGTTRPTLQPPTRVNPSPVLPGRESTITPPVDSPPPPARPPRTDTLDRS